MKKIYMIPETLVVKIAINNIMLGASGAGMSGLGDGVTKEEYNGSTPVSWARGGLWDDDDE